MFRLSPRLTVGAALLLGVALLSAPARGRDDDEKEIKQAAEAVKKLAGNLDAKNVEQQAAAIAKANDIEHVMHQFKPRNKGGMGIGAAPIPGMKDSIELAIIDFSGKKAPDAATIKQNQADLIKMAEITQAIAEINQHYKAPPGKAAPQKWKTYTNDMKAGAKDLTDAAKAGDAMKFKAAANKLNASCTGCHEDFRD